MNSEWLTPAKILTGICVLAASGFSQTYTISAKPGALNFIEGDVTINGDAVWKSNVKSTFLNQNDVIAVKHGRAEVLLNPGVFLRLADNSEVRMVKPSLIDTQLEALNGETMLEVDNLEPGTSVTVLDHGSSTSLVKPGLYKFTQNSVAVLDGKADVTFGARKVELKKNKQVEIGDALAESKVDLNAGDDLYAWSNNRAQYNAAASYAGSTNVYNAGGYGFSSYNSPGWYWNSPFNSYMWLPGNGAFYSPFGWGFYGPGVVSFAPVFTYPFYGSGGYYSGVGVSGVLPVRKPTAGALSQLVVPVNPKNVGAANVQSNSPAAFAAARNEVQRDVAYYGGFRTARGAPAADLRSGQTFSSMHEATRAAAASARSASPAGGGEFSGAHAGGASSSNAGVMAAAPSGHASGSSGGHSK